MSVISLGCRLNAYESEIMRSLAPSGTIVVNTCAVTAEAERQGRAALRRAVRERPGAPVVVTGCAAQIAPLVWGALPGVTRVLGNADKLRPEAWAASGSDVSDVMVAPWAPAPAVTSFENRARALVQVQQGCDHRCTFCAIPFGRGPSRSVPAESAADRVASLVHAGFREITLTGVDIASWGSDLPDRPRLGALVRHVLRAVPSLARLRLSSLDPGCLDDTLIGVLGDEPRLMPHLHLSLQAGSDLVLKRMRRRHSRAGALAAIERARRARPGLAVGADLIAGFPTETDALFRQTLDFVDEAALPYLHVFPFSERPGTPGARMPPVPVAERRARAAALRAAGRRRAEVFYSSQVGNVVQVLIERGARGHSEHFAPVRFDPADVAAAPGQLVPLRVIGAGADGLEVG